MIVYEIIKYKTMLKRPFVFLTKQVYVTKEKNQTIQENFLLRDVSPMISQEMFFNLFANEVRKLSAEKGISESEAERVILIFQEAMKNPYMDERVIFRRLAGDMDAA